MPNDELTLRLKVDGADSNKNLEKTNDQLKKIKKNSDETNDSFGLADTKVGKLFKSFKTGAKTGVNSMKTLKGAIAATGIGLLVLAVTSLVKWFTGTEKGAEKLKVIMAALGQVVATITDTFIKIGEALSKIGGIIKGVVKGNKSLAEGFKEAKDVVKESAESIKSDYEGISDSVQRAIDLQKRENQLIRDKRTNLVEEAKLQVELANVKERVDDATLTAIERIGLLNKQEKIQNELFDERVRVAEEEFTIMKQRSALASDDIAAKDALAQAEANLILVEADRANAQKEITAKRSAFLKAEQDQKAAAEEADIARNEKAEEDADTAAEKEIQRAQKVADEIKTIEDQAYLDSIEDDEERREAQIELEDERFEEDLERRIEAEEITKEEADRLMDARVDAAIAADKKRLDSAKKTAEEITAKENKEAEKQKKIDELVAINKGQLISSTLNIVSKAIGEETALGKAAAITAIGIDTVLASMSAFKGMVSSIPGPIGIALGLVAAVGVGVMGAIAQADIISARDGGWIVGDSHANGGVNLPSGINAENEEFIVNARTMRNPRMAQDVMKLNAAGNAGFETSVSTTMSPEQVAEVVAASIEAIPVVVTENQITTAQRNVIVREDRFTVGQTNNR